MRFPQGHDTTAAAITWALYLLGRHPVIQRKVHEEVDSFLGEFVLSVFCFCFRFFFSVTTRTFLGTSRCTARFKKSPLVGECNIEGQPLEIVDVYKD